MLTVVCVLFHIRFARSAIHLSSMMMAVNVEAESALTYQVSGGHFDSPYFTISPPLTRFIKGNEYIFQADGISASHPFKIGVTLSDDLPVAFGKTGPSAGLTGSTGQIRFTVPSDYSAAGSLTYYWCAPC